VFSYKTFLEENGSFGEENNHQRSFMLGFKASVLLREGLEDGALEVTKEAMKILKVGSPPISFLFFFLVPHEFSFLSRKHPILECLTTFYPFN